MQRREMLMTSMEKRDSERGHRLRDLMTYSICSEWEEDKENREEDRRKLNHSVRSLKSHLKISIMERNLNLKLTDREFAPSVME